MNCINCKYANFLSDGNVECDRNYLSDDRIVVIDKDKIHRDCACHSDIDKEEIRYGYDNKNIKKSDDVCEYCQRVVKNKTQLCIIPIRHEVNIRKTRVCILCKKKYFPFS